MPERGKWWATANIALIDTLSNWPQFSFDTVVFLLILVCFEKKKLQSNEMKLQVAP